MVKWYMVYMVTKLTILLNSEVRASLLCARISRIIMHFPLSILIGCRAGQFVIALNSDVTPADNSFSHVDMMSFLQIIVFHM